MPVRARLRGRTHELLTDNYFTAQAKIRTALTTAIIGKQMKKGPFNSIKEVLTFSGGEG